MHYDRSYDTSHSTLMRRLGVKPCNCRNCNPMREAGVEPASLSAPDPKSRTSALGDGAESANAAPGSATERLSARGLRPIVRHGVFFRPDEPEGACLR